jgi:hypothetical protein
VYTVFQKTHKPHRRECGIVMEVSRVARGYLNQRVRREGLERTVTFSIRLTEGQNAKLRFLAERFGESKSPLAQRLLDAAMEEALRTLGAYDAVDEEAGLTPDEANRVIDAQVEKYRDEIQRIFDKGIKD